MTSDSEKSNWCTIESDPGVFTCLIESFGVKNVELTELYSLDDDSLKQCTGVGGGGGEGDAGGPLYGLIFLFKWTKEIEGKDDRTSLTGDDIPADLFFARQTVPNACATQAILSVLLNNASSSPIEPKDENGTNDNDAAADSTSQTLQVGPMLTQLHSFIQSFPPDLRGEAIGASEEIRQAHNSFARPTSVFIEDNRPPQNDDDGEAFHFVAYVPHKASGKVYELDGLKGGPILLGEYDTTKGDAWWNVARQAIQTRIEQFGSSEIKFNLMAMVGDKRVMLQDRIKSAEEQKLGGIIVDDMKALLAEQDEKRTQWKRENDRRRHNYLPFCVELIKGLAKTGKLKELTEEARKTSLGKMHKRPKI
eukprot:CAMPEP_0194394242 /NCGR_PEP_ID=MMETSP0174-20130528/123749_1 /TAXON_ID=216777 /ORGANISM="Proboscia alata, Strain PI-D3" /LENGTH=363 /DNA_ID=CAMNT_0039190023 /DNA_START=72 /DNA_END=1163 /DNA_ORIENTATION=-